MDTLNCRQKRGLVVHTPSPSPGEIKAGLEVQGCTQPRHLAQSKPGLLETLSQKTNKQVAGINPYWFCYLGPEGKWALTLSVLGAPHSYRVSLAFCRFFHLSAEMAEMVAEECRIFFRSPDFTFLSKVLKFPQRLGHWSSDISETLRSVLALLVFLMEYTFSRKKCVGIW